MTAYIPPPPAHTGELAIYAAATVLCLAFKHELPPSQLQAALDRGLASVGLQPLPHPQVVPVWGLAVQLIQNPQACPILLTP